jgi:hypothetical protein
VGWEVGTAAPKHLDHQSASTFASETQS